MSLVLFSAFAIFISLAPYYHKNQILTAQLNFLLYGGLLSILPFIYFYVRHIATKEKIELKQQSIHLFPALLFSIIGLFIPLSLSSEELKLYSLDLSFDSNLHWTVFFFQLIEKISKLLFIIQSVFYLFLISKLIKDYKKRVNNYFSNINNPYFNWIHLFYIVFIISFLATTTMLIVGNTNMIKEDNHILTVCLLTLSMVFYLIAFIADNHEYIPDETFYSNEQFSTIDLHSIPMQEDLAKKLQEYFEQQKPFLQGDLKITIVAKALATNRTYISEAIKNVFNLNFNDFVNGYRIEEAKAILSEKKFKDITITEIYDKAGFNNYNSFAKAFKKKYKCTPSNYRKKILANN